MPHPVFNRETLLDVSVNLIPLVIIVFFVSLFFLASPWPDDLLVEAVMLLLHVVPFAVLVALTYVTARYL